MNSVISKLKVVEVASVLAGPAVGMFFAERGAQVLKVENKKTNGDVTREWKLAEESKESSISAYFCSVNWHKSHLFLDLVNEEDQRQVHDMIRECDILIANFKKGDAEKFKLDFDTVREINPKIIHAELSGFGAKSDRVAYDLVLQAETGFMSMNGTETSGPVKMPLAMIDILAAHQMKEGIFEALIERESQPKAYHVEVSLYDSAIATLANQATNYLMVGKVPKAIGSKHPNISPYGETFETKDREFITFAVGSDSQFSNLLDVLEIAKNSKYATNKERVEYRNEVAEMLAEKVIQFDSTLLIEKLIELKVPVAKIQKLDEVFSNPEAQRLILEEDFEGEKTRRVKTAVYQITAV